MPRPDDDGYHNPNCVNFLPIAILLTIVYALPRLAVASIGERLRARRRSVRVLPAAPSRLLTGDELVALLTRERA